MKFGADNLPDDPVLLKALILQLQEENALLRHKLFSPKSERSPEDTDSPQLAMFNEAEELIEALSAAPAEAEEIVAPVKRRGKRKPLPANLPGPPDVAFFTGPPCPPVDARATAPRRAPGRWRQAGRSR